MTFTDTGRRCESRNRLSGFAKIHTNPDSPKLTRIRIRQNSHESGFAGSHFEFGLDEVGSGEAGLSAGEMRRFSQLAEVSGDGFVAGEAEEGVVESAAECSAVRFRETYPDSVRFCETYPDSDRLWDSYPDSGWQFAPPVSMMHIQRMLVTGT